MVKAGTSIPAARQMILANLKSAPVVTTHGGSPKKQVRNEEEIDVLPFAILKIRISDCRCNI